MSKRNRVKRSREDLKRELREQLQLLAHACRTYDAGHEAIGKHIALSLRVLLHSYGQSRALLEQLGLRKGRFFDSAGALNPRNLLSESPLIVHSLSDTGGGYLPLMAAGTGPLGEKEVAFAEWWNEPVLKDVEGRKFSRLDLVLHVADTDGGAHVDPELDAAYMALSRAN